MAKEQSPYQKMMSRSKQNDEGEALDFYETPPEATQALIDNWHFPAHEIIWEPAVGKGAILDVFHENKLPMHYWSDIKDYETDELEVPIIDFLKPPYNPAPGFPVTSIVTNPPYKLAQEFFHRAYEYLPEGGKIAFLLRLMWLEGKKRRREIYKPYPPKQVLVFSGRLGFQMPDGRKKKSGMVPYCWIIWEKGFQGETLIDWIETNV